MDESRRSASAILTFDEVQIVIGSIQFETIGRVTASTVGLSDPELLNARV